jgi:ribosomal protein S18 acetylase RimI-like enzyme
MELADRGHAAMADRYALGAEIDAGEVVRTGDGVVYAGRTDFPVMFNAAIPLGGDPRALVAFARDFFAGRGRGFSFFARADAEDEAAVEAGMELVLDRYPAMVRREQFDDRPVAGIEMRRVGDEGAARDYLAVAAPAFTALGMPEGLLAGMPPAAFLRDDTAAFVAYDGDRPLACASVTVARGVGGIQWVGVLEEARGRGLAAACTRAASNAGFELGADCAWLEASHMGEPVYLRMGFEELFSYRLYVAAAPGAASRSNI